MGDNGRQDLQESREPLAGSVKPYRHHLAVCTGGPPELWASRVEEMEGLFAALSRALSDAGLGGSVKLTACDEPSLTAEGLDAFLMPEMIRLPALTTERVPLLIRALQQEFREGSPFPVTPMAGGDHLFVCVHQNRDDRCGRWGPPLVDALAAEITKQAAAAHVHQTSHIGGHRYAATCILYPAGIWYGNLRPEDAATLVQRQLTEERLWIERYRGRMGISPCTQVAEAVAARVLESRYPTYELLAVHVDESGRHASARVRARVRARRRLVTVEATFTLSCPTLWWEADDTPHFTPRT